MIIPIPAPVFLSAGADGKDTFYDIHLNRSGINSIDLPRETVTAEPGTSLRLRLLNRGAPIHITLTSSNADMYTDFYHENLYVVDESLLTIPIRKDCREGTFDFDIISGYGVMKAQLQVHIAHLPVMRPAILEEYPLQPVSHGRPHLLMIMMGIALILYCAWLYTYNEVLNIASFIILIVGALYTWYRQQ